MVTPMKPVFQRFITPDAAGGLSRSMALPLHRFGTSGSDFLNHYGLLHSLPASVWGGGDDDDGMGMMTMMETVNKTVKKMF